jgi:hypothetical protein
VPISARADDELHFMGLCREGKRESERQRVNKLNGYMNPSTITRPLCVGERQSEQASGRACVRVCGRSVSQAFETGIVVGQLPRCVGLAISVDIQARQALERAQNSCCDSRREASEYGWSNNSDALIKDLQCLSTHSPLPQEAGIACSATVGGRASVPWPHVLLILSPWLSLFLASASGKP